VRSLNDRRFEVIIATALRTGVTISASLVLLGGICYLSRHGAEFPAYGVFQDEPARYRNLSGAIMGIEAGDCRALIQFGLLVLIATPIARVALSLAIFALQGDRLYTAITLVVLVVLLFSLIH